MNMSPENSGVRSEVILVTPELAKEWLESKADYQRSISPVRVRRLARLMERQEWKVTPTHQVGISSSGQVVDGQHRLSAVILSGVSVLMAVVFNCPEDIFDAIDVNNYKRTTAQIAKMAGKAVNSRSQIAALDALLVDPVNPHSMNLTWQLHDVLFLLDYYEEEIRAIFPEGYSGKQQVVLAAFRGACLRALISMPDKKQEIVDFVKTVANNAPLDNSSIDIRMPLMFYRAYSKMKTADQGERFGAYCLTLIALRHAISGTVIKHACNFRSIRAPKVQPFPISLDRKPKWMKVSSYLCK